MAHGDPAKDLKTALAEAWADNANGATVTLEVPDDYRPVAGAPVLLIADDGGRAENGGAWLAGRDLLRIVLRMTAFARGRTEARAVLTEAIDYVLANRPAGIARIENIPAVLDTRDRDTGAYLASITMPVVVRPITTTPEEQAMAGDASNIRVWESGDVYILDPTATFVEATHVPADIDAALDADWIPAGLMLGTPGVGMARSIDRTDVNSWQQGRVLERIKNPKVDITFTLLEDNDVTADLVDPAAVPGVRKRHVALEFVDDAGYVKRWISKAPVSLFVAADNQEQDVNGREVTGSLVPVAGEYWTIQEGTPAP